MEIIRQCQPRAKIQAVPASRWYLSRVKYPVSAAREENQAVQACFQADETRLAKRRSNHAATPQSLHDATPLIPGTGGDQWKPYAQYFRQCMLSSTALSQETEETNSAYRYSFSGSVYSHQQYCRASIVTFWPAWLSCLVLSDAVTAGKPMAIRCGKTVA